MIPTNAAENPMKAAIPNPPKADEPDPEGVDTLAAPSQMAQSVARNTIAAGQVNNGDSRDWAENAVAGVQTALAGFGAAGKVPEGAGAAYGIGAAARAQQERRDQQRQQKQAEADKQQALQMEKQRLADEEAKTTQEQQNWDKDYQIHLAENARQQAQQVHDFWRDDQNLKLAQSTNEREAQDAKDRHAEFVQRQQDYLWQQRENGGKPAMIGGQESPTFDDQAQLEAFARTNKLDSAHENGFIFRPLQLEDGKFQIWEQPDKRADFGKILDPYGRPMSSYADPTGAMANFHTMAETRQLNAAAARDNAEAQKDMQAVADAKGTKEVSDILAGVTGPDGTINTKGITPKQMVQVRKSMLDQWRTASVTIKTAQAEMSQDPAYVDAVGDAAKMQALEAQYGIPQASQMRDYAANVLYELDGGVYKAAKQNQVAQDLNSPESAVNNLVQNKQAEQVKQQQDLQTENDRAVLNMALNKGGRSYDKDLAKLVAEHPNWTEDDRLNAMRALMKARGITPGGNQQPGGATTFSDGGLTYNIPPDKVDAFLKDHPNAQKQ